MRPLYRMTEAGYNWSAWGENILYKSSSAAGYVTADDIVQSWMDSDGHCKNIMDPGVQDLGVGYYQEYGDWEWEEESVTDKWVHLWTMDFGKQ